MPLRGRVQQAERFLFRQGRRNRRQEVQVGRGEVIKLGE